MSFQPLDFDALEQLTSKKMQSLAANFDYLYSRKNGIQLKNINPVTQHPANNPPVVSSNIGFVAEYRDISPGDAFPETQTETTLDDFSKVVKFPSGYFDNNYEPIIIASIGAKYGAIRRVVHQVTSISSEGFTYKVVDSSTSSIFTEGMPFFLTYMAFGVKAQKRQERVQTHTSVTFPSNGEIKSSDLNLLVDNSDYLSVNKLEGILRNTDPVTKNPRSAIPWIRDNLAIYTEYQEFTPGADILDLNQEPTKQQFDRTFNFPTAFFNPLFQPIVLVTLGSQPDNIAKIMGILRRVDSASFTISILDQNTQQTATFKTNSKLFISYVALGVKGDGSSTTIEDAGL